MYNSYYDKVYILHIPQGTCCSLFQEARRAVGDCCFQVCITDSGAINLGKALDIGFVQEVVAVATARKAAEPQTDAGGVNDAVKNYKQIYPVAARCGVFAKTDI